jgi:hypothetical protein
MAAAEAVRLATSVACYYGKMTGKKEQKKKYFVSLHHFLRAFAKL